MEWIMRGIGAFYVFCGVIMIRQAIINWRLEGIFGAFLETPPAEKAADVMLTIIAVLVLISGVGLVTLHALGPYAVLACWGMQAIYLLWANRWHRPVEPELVKLRRQTTNAFFVYTAVTLMTLWGLRTGLFA